MRGSGFEVFPVLVVRGGEAADVVKNAATVLDMRVCKTEGGKAITPRTNPPRA